MSNATLDVTSASALAHTNASVCRLPASSYRSSTAHSSGGYPHTAAGRRSPRHHLQERDRDLRSSRTSRCVVTIDASRHAPYEGSAAVAERLFAPGPTSPRHEEPFDVRISRSCGAYRLSYGADRQTDLRSCRPSCTWEWTAKYRRACCPTHSTST